MINGLSIKSSYRRCARKNLFLGIQACNFMKKKLLHRCFSVNVFKNIYFQDNLPAAASEGIHLPPVPLTGFFQNLWKQNLSKQDDEFVGNKAYLCVSGGKKCSFFGKFGELCFLEKLVLRFVLLPYYRRIIQRFKDSCCCRQIIWDCLTIFWCWCLKI